MSWRALLLVLRLAVCQGSLLFWVEPVALARNLGFRPRELAELERIVQDNREAFREAWREYFGS